MPWSSHMSYGLQLYFISNKYIFHTSSQLLYQVALLETVCVASNGYYFFLLMIPDIN